MLVVQVGKRLSQYAVVAACAWLILGQTTSAVSPPTFVVNTMNDMPDINPGNGICETTLGQGTCSLRAAIMEANHVANGPATIDLRGILGNVAVLSIPASGGDTEESGDLNLLASVNIIGAGAGVSYIDASALGDRVFNVNPGSGILVSISGVTIRNGHATGNGGAINIATSGSTVALNNCEVTGSSAGGNGGGIASGVGNVTLVNTTVSGNQAATGGGGIYSAGALTVESSTISGNTAQFGGGIAADVNMAGSVVNSTVSGNTAQFGGGLYTLSGGVSVGFFNATLSNNRATNAGQGGGVNAVAGTTRLTNTILAGNFGGGGAAADDCSGTITSTASGSNLMGTKANCTVAGTGPVITGNPMLGPLQSNGGSTLTQALLPGSPAINAGPLSGCVSAGGPILTNDQRGFPRPAQGVAPCDLGAFELISVDRHDFNGDGKADIVWHNPTTGENGMWLMGGFTVQAASAIAGISPPWQVAGTGDFNGDGIADILWRNPQTGENAIWIMSAFSVVTSQAIPGASSAFQVAGVGDFDGDGRADILWHNPTTGENGMWLMSGTAIKNFAALPTTNTAWSIVGVGDFDGDGHVDLLWRDLATGDNGMWLMNGFSITGAQAIPGAGASWVVAGVADFNGDGRTDILWRNPSTGENGLWTMNGLAISGAQALPGAGVGWNIVETEDFFADGHADILWRNPATGENGMWRMNGFSIVGAQALPTSGVGWEIK
jgi:CSLREA domain-containing protein